MKKLFTLVALLGMVCSGAWAEDYELQPIYSQNYESAISTGWNSQNASAALETTNGNTYVKFYDGAARTRTYYTNLSSSISTLPNFPGWAMSVDVAFKTYDKSYDPTHFHLTSSTHNEVANSTQSIANCILSLTSSVHATGNDKLYDIFVGSNKIGSVTISNMKFYTINLDYNGSTYTVSLKDESGNDVNITNTSSESVISVSGNPAPEDNVGAPKGFTIVGQRSGSATTQAYVDNIVFSKYVAAGVVADPTYNIVRPNGISRIVDLSCATYGSEIYYSESELTTAEGGTLYSSSITTSASTIWMYAKKGSTTSEVINFETGAGSTIVLNSPAVSVSFIQEGETYVPVYTFTSNQSEILGNPSVTYSYSVNDSPAEEGASYKATSTGVLAVTANASGYDKSVATEVSINNIIFEKALDYNFATLFNSHSETAAGNAQTINGVGVQCYGIDADAIEGLTLNNIQHGWAITANKSHSLYTRNGKGTITVVNFPAGSYAIYNDKAYDTASTQFNQYTAIYTMQVYVPQAEVAGNRIGYTNNNSDYLAAKTTPVTLSNGETLKYSFVNHNSGSGANWNNWILNVQQNAADVVNLRADFWEDIVGGNTGCEANIKWTNFVADMNGATVDMTITYNDGTLIVNNDITTSSKQSWFYNYTKSGLEGDLTFALSVNKSWLEILSTEKILPENVTCALGSYGYATFSAPYALNLDEITDGYTAYQATSIDGETVTIEPVEGTVAANTGLIIKGNAGNCTIPVVAEGTDISATNKLVAVTADNTVVPAGAYVLGIDNDEVKFLLTSEEHKATLGAGKSYLAAPAGASARLRMVIKGETTGIQNVNVANAKQNVIYNLAGQRVNANAKGIVLVNGKKVIK